METAGKMAIGDDGCGTGGAPRYYINHIAVSFSLSEMRIDFGQNFPNENGTRPQCRLVTSPMHLQQIESQIASALQNYCSEFGAIPTFADEDASGGQGQHGAA
jgi:hypothetical protein